jgi:hypothetical protein
MTSSRAWWWLRKDVDRLLGRAEHSSGGPASDDELAYMVAQAQLLLTGPLALDGRDRARIELLYAALVDTLAERVVERIETP